MAPDDKSDVVEVDSPRLKRVSVSREKNRTFETPVQCGEVNITEEENESMASPKKQTEGGNGRSRSRVMKRPPPPPIPHSRQQQKSQNTSLVLNQGLPVARKRSLSARFRDLFKKPRSKSRDVTQQRSSSSSIANHTTQTDNASEAEAPVNNGSPLEEILHIPEVKTKRIIVKSPDKLKQELNWKLEMLKREKQMLDMELSKNFTKLRDARKKSLSEDSPSKRVVIKEVTPAKCLHSKGILHRKRDIPEKQGTPKEKPTIRPSSQEVRPVILPQKRKESPPKNPPKKEPSIKKQELKGKNYVEVPVKKELDDSGKHEVIHVSKEPRKGPENSIKPTSLSSEFEDEKPGKKTDSSTNTNIHFSMEFSSNTTQNFRATIPVGTSVPVKTRPRKSRSKTPSKMKNSKLGKIEEERVNEEPSRPIEKSRNQVQPAVEATEPSGDSSPMVISEAEQNVPLKVESSQKMEFTHKMEVSPYMEISHSAQFSQNREIRVNAAENIRRAREEYFRPMIPQDEQEQNENPAPNENETLSLSDRNEIPNVDEFSQGDVGNLGVLPTSFADLGEAEAPWENVNIPSPEPPPVIANISTENEEQRNRNMAYGSQLQLLMRVNPKFSKLEPSYEYLESIPKRYLTVARLITMKSPCHEKDVALCLFLIEQDIHIEMTYNKTETKASELETLLLDAIDILQNSEHEVASLDEEIPKEEFSEAEVVSLVLRVDEQNEVNIAKIGAETIEHISEESGEIFGLLKEEDEAWKCSEETHSEDLSLPEIFYTPTSQLDSNSNDSSPMDEKSDSSPISSRKQNSPSSEQDEIEPPKAEAILSGDYIEELGDVPSLNVRSSETEIPETSDWRAVRLFSAVNLLTSGAGLVLSLHNGDMLNPLQYFLDR